MTASFEEIVALAKDRTHAGRRRLAACFGDTFFVRAEDFSQTERYMALEIMAALLRDAEIEIRKELARRYADSTHAPHSLVVGLAKDVIEVARPILLYSPVLRDDDLVGIIEERGVAHRMVIANRQHIGGRVADALAQTRDPLVAMTLLQNQKSRLPESTLKELARQALENTELSHSIVLRPEITAELAKQMYWLVSQELRQHLSLQFRFEPKMLDKTLQEVVQSLVEKNSDPEKNRTIAVRLISSGAIEANFMIELLKSKGLMLFQMLMEELTHIPAKNLEFIYTAEGLEAMAVICRALDFSKTQTASLMMLVRDRISGDDQFDPADLAKALALFARLTKADAQTILWQWESDPSFLCQSTSGWTQ